MYKIKIQKKGVQFQVAMLMCFVIKLSQSIGTSAAAPVLPMNIQG